MSLNKETAKITIYMVITGDFIDSCVSVRPDLALSTASWHPALHCCIVRRVVPGNSASLKPELL